MNKEYQKIFALIYVSGKLPKKELELMGFDPDREFISKLNTIAQQNGLEVIETDSAISLGLNADFRELIQDKEKADDNISESASEVLTLILYMHPVTKSNIDYIRGVNSSSTLKRLMIRGLVERRKESGQIFYYPTVELMAHLGINKPQDMPEYNAFASKLKQILESNEQI